MRWSSQTYQHAQAWYSSLFFFKGQYWKDCFFKSLCLKFVYVCFYSPYMYRFCRFDLRKGLHIIYVYIYMKEFWNMSLLLTECDCPEVILWTGCYITTYPFPGFNLKKFTQSKGTTNTVSSPSFSDTFQDHFGKVKLKGDCPRIQSL